MLKAVDTAKNSVADAEKEIPIQPVSQDIWDKKYRLKTKQGDNVDADMDASFSRVARALADVETTEEKRAEWHEKFLWALRRGAIPAGRITSNAGALEHKPATSTINCTVSGVISDSMDDILGKVHEAGLTLKAGCGIGYEFPPCVQKGRSWPVPVLTPAAPSPSWISTTKCVSPYPVPVVVVVRKWLPSIFHIRM